MTKINLDIIRRRDLKKAILLGNLQEVKAKWKNPEEDLLGADGGHIPLYFAAKGKNPDVLSWVANRTPKISSEFGARALAAALIAAKEENSKILLKLGANPNRPYAKDVDTCPLYATVRYGSKKSLLLALNVGCDPSKTPGDYWASVLEIAVKPMKMKPSEASVITRLLISHGAPVNRPRKDGNTPLHIASREGNQAVVEALLFGGANSSAKNKAGQTPLQMARNITFQKTLSNLIKGTPQSASKAKIQQNSKLNLEKAYSAYEGLFFEGPWINDTLLGKTFINWARKEHTQLIGSTNQPAQVEGLLKDEIGVQTISNFVSQIPRQMRHRALAAIQKSVGGLYIKRNWKAVSLF